MLLAFESSCDESAVALFDSASGMRAQLIHSQVAAHSAYGGVVPELAARDHCRYLPQLCQRLLEAERVPLPSIQAIAYTAGPGLIGALLAGASYAHALAYALRIPAYVINHLEAHLLVPMLDCPQLRFPYVALLASGGHTSLYLVETLGVYRLLGDSLDDACGEAIDKTARLLGLPYPGGAELERLARSGVAGRYKFSRPLARREGFDFSFSGLKTQARHLLERVDQGQGQQWRADVALAFQQTVIDSLLSTSLAATAAMSCKQLVVSGGVSANSELRAQAQQLGAQAGVEIYFPKPELSTDNALMVAYAAARRIQAELPPAERLKVVADPRLKL